MNFANKALILGTLFLLSCARHNDLSTAENGTAYAKSDLGTLQSCQFHTDCTSLNQACIALLVSAGFERRCYSVGDEGNYVACTKGELIMLSGDPEQFACH